jgi:hypothetical protein
MASCSRWLVPWNVHLQMIIHRNVSIIAAKFSEFQRMIGRTVRTTREAMRRGSRAWPWRLLTAEAVAGQKHVMRVLLAVHRPRVFFTDH